MTYTDPHPTYPYSAPGAPAVPAAYGPAGVPTAYPPRPSRRVGVAGLTLSFAGAVSLVASFTTLRWFDAETIHLNDDRSGTFDLVHSVLARIRIVPGVDTEPLAVHYFSWLAWTLLAAAVVAAAIANLPVRAAGAFRAVGTLVGLAGAGITFAAIDLLDVGPGASAPDPSYGTYFGSTSVGFWAAVGGFATLGLGALIGARRNRY